MRLPLTKTFYERLLNSGKFNSKHPSNEFVPSPSSTNSSPNVKPQRGWLNHLVSHHSYSRFIIHVSILALIGSIVFVGDLAAEPVKEKTVAVSRDDLSGAVTARVVPVSPATEVEAPQPLVPTTELNNFTYDILRRNAVPMARMPELPRQEIGRYTVQSGDTVYGIAYKFGLQPETVLWANQQLEDNPHWLRPGQELKILPFDGIYHQVGGNDTIGSIASTYKTTAEAIIETPLNNLDEANPIIQIGQWLVVPGGRKRFVPPMVRSATSYSVAEAPAGVAAGTGVMSWPISGRISQGFYGYHPAIDIESPIGTPVHAIDGGFVVFAGWGNSGYGYHVVIDHGNGFQSLYAHLQEYYPQAGASVQKGQTIGTVGMTGRTSGAHLHLEIRQGTIQLNPLGYLP